MNDEQSKKNPQNELHNIKYASLYLETQLAKPFKTKQNIN